MVLEDYGNCQVLVVNFYLFDHWCNVVILCVCLRALLPVFVFHLTVNLCDDVTIITLC
jgi:hypothetical protein